EVAQCAVVLERVATPGLEVHLVDRDRLPERVVRAAALAPVVVAPLVAGAIDTGSRGRRDLGRECVRVGLQRQQLALRSLQLVLVALTLAEAGNEELPDA